MASFEELRPLAEAKIAELGAELFDARFFRAGPRAVLRITIDRESGVSVADCEAVSGAVGELLDEKDFLGGKPYTLEVSSPGIDRPLKTERDFARIAGRDVTVNLNVAVLGKKTLRGTVLGCTNGVLSVSVGKETVNIPLADVLSGKEEVRFK